MKQSVENGWSSNVLKIQIETNLFKRQIETQKVNNFTKTLPAPQSDLANYLLKWGNKQNPFQYHQWMFAALRRLSCLSFEFAQEALA